MLVIIHVFSSFNEKEKLIDFGCAVDVDDDSTTFGGTSEYMAPEVGHILCLYMKQKSHEIFHIQYMWNTSTNTGGWTVKVLKNSKIY